MTDTDKTRETSTPARRQGRLQTWRARWFGERDEVADQLADIARQGSGMARLAHVCASLMLVLFSAGSLVALGGDALLSVLDGAQQGHVDLPAAISLGVSTLLVLCMDVAMLYAASMLRLLGDATSGATVDAAASWGHGDGSGARSRDLRLHGVAI